MQLVACIQCWQRNISQNMSDTFIKGDIDIIYVIYQCQVRENYNNIYSTLNSSDWILPCVTWYIVTR